MSLHIGRNIYTEDGKYVDNITVPKSIWIENLRLFLHWKIRNIKLFSITSNQFKFGVDWQMCVFVCCRPISSLLRYRDLPLLEVRNVTMPIVEDETFFLGVSIRNCLLFVGILCGLVYFPLSFYQNYFNYLYVLLIF